MKTIITSFLLICSLHINAQDIDTYLKFTNPAIVGPESYGGKTGCFLLTGFTYDLQTNNGKILPGSLKMNIIENSKLPDIWSLFLATTPISLEIYQFKTISTNPSLFRTIILKNAYINAIKYNSDTQNAGNHELDFWMNQFSFEYRVFNSNGSLVSTHTTGWDFVNNTIFNF